MNRRLSGLPIGLMSLVLSSRPVFSQSVEINLAAIRSEAVTRFRAGNYTQALTLYRRLADLQPENISAKKDLMWALWNAGQFEEAGQVASSILAQHPADTEAQNVLKRVPATANREKIKHIHEEAVASYQAGDYPKAIDYYQQLAELNPQDSLMLRDLMWALWHEQRYDEAAQVAEKILNLRPSDADASDALSRLPDALKTQQIILKRAKIAALLQKAQVSQQTQNYKEALPLMRELVALDPENPAGYNELLSILEKSGQYDEGLLAAQQMTVARKMDPNSWNWLGTFQLHLNDTHNAVESFKYALALDPHQPRLQLTVGRMYLMLREFDTAIPYLQSALDLNPSMLEGYPLLAKALYWNGQFRESADMWTKAANSFPQSSEYKFYEAQAFFFSGRQELARSKMRTLWESDHNIRAFDFLVNDAIVQNDVAHAEHMLAEVTQTIQPQDEPHVMKLASLYEANGQKDKLIALLDRYLQVSPDHEPALLTKAAALFDQGHYAQALAVYQKVHDLNPYDTEAVRGLAECEQSMDHVSSAMRWMHQLRALDPTNPRFILMEAQYDGWTGQTREARAFLTRWVHANEKSPVLPIVLYHGLTPFTDDPMLAYPYHYSMATFDDHMRAIHDAGYTPVTSDEVTAWYAGKGHLPKHPILITFDDGRLDSFRYGDPILLKYQLKATMCAALVNIEGSHPPGFLPWPRMSDYQRTGRWDIVSHGDISHIMIPMDEAGNQALFLVNKKWLADQSRLETDAEWEERIRSDYQSSRDKIQKNIGTTPSAYAFPEGIFGQEGHINTPHAKPVNQKLVGQYFKLAFSQDRAGLNLLESRDPLLLNRHEPDPRWTGKDLIAFFHNQNPINLGYEQLFDLAVWDGRIREANYWLERMRKNDVSQPVLMIKEAEMRLAAGDLAEGQALVQRAMTMESTPEIERSITTTLATTGPSWIPSYTYDSDNEGRHDWVFAQTLTSTQFWKTKWSLIQRHGEYSETQQPRVIDNAYGASADIQLGLFQALHIEGMQHYIPHQKTGTTYSAQGRLDSQVTDSLETVVSGGRDNYYTARALNDNVHDNFVDALLKLHPEGPWLASLRGRYLDLSDDNIRRVGQAELSRAILFPNHLRLVYQFTYDDMRFVSPDYYSPQSLRMHALGPQLVFKTTEHTEFMVRYLPAYAAERNIPWEFDQSVETYLQLHLNDKNYLKPSFTFSRTPTYRENIYSVEFQHYF